MRREKKMKKPKVYIESFENTERKKVVEEANKFIKTHKVVGTHEHVTNVAERMLVYTIFCFYEVFEEDNK
jgi:hypothetical protein